MRVKLELERSNFFKQGHIYEHSHQLYQSQQTEMIEMLINEWKMWYNHTIENYTAIKRNEVDAQFHKKNLGNVK